MVATDHFFFANWPLVDPGRPIIMTFDHSKALRSGLGFDQILVPISKQSVTSVAIYKVMTYTKIASNLIKYVIKQKNQNKTEQTKKPLRLRVKR